jgi:FMN phosphatase YigB (HAD superfamily)
VCFDLGGVLVRLCSGWEEAYVAAGLDVRPVPMGPAVQARRRELVHLFDAGAISLAEWAEGVSRAIDRVYSPGELARVHAAFLKDEYEGALALVDELHDAGIMTACLSNTNEAHWLRLAHVDGEGPRSGVPEFPAVAKLRHRLASHLLRAVKPNPEIYAHLERATGARGRAIVFFDDREDNVEAARRHGWHAAVVDPRGDPVAHARRTLVLHGLLEEARAAARA